MADNVVRDRQRWTSAPYFIVDDVVATANYYRDKLGFQYERFWGDPPAFTMIWRRGVVIMLGAFGKPGLMRPNGAADDDAEGCWDAYIWIDESADTLYEEFKSKGVKIRREIRDEPYGNRDFNIEDCNGYILCFGQNLEQT